MRGKQAPDGAFFMPKDWAAPRQSPLESTDTTGKIMTRNLPTSAAAPPRRTLLILLTALSVLPVNIYLPALPDIAADFQADPALVNLSVAGNAIVTALIELIAGGLSDRYGRRPIALISISMFIAASIGCALAPNIYVFLLFRALQASIAACFSVALVMIKETSHEREAAGKMGYAAMGWAIAPMLGPTIGGILNELLGWRAIFVILAMFGAAILSASFRGLREPTAQSTRSNTHYLASYGLLLSSARFWAYALCMACSMGTLYIFLGGAPLVVGPLLDGSSATLGLYMGMVPAGFIFGSYLTTLLASRNSLGFTLFSARLLTCMGLLVGLALSMTGAVHPFAFFAPCVFIGIGNGLTLPAANLGVMSVRDDLAGTAAGLAAAMSIAGGAIIASIAGLFLRESGETHTLLGLLLTSATLALSAALVAGLVDKQQTFKR